MGSISGSGRCPGEGNGNPLQYSCLEILLTEEPGRIQSMGSEELELEMGIPDHLTCLLRNLYAGQEATVRTGCGTIDWFQIGKGVRQGYILSPCLFNFYAEYIRRNTGLDKA